MRLGLFRKKGPKNHVDTAEVQALAAQAEYWMKKREELYAGPYRRIEKSANMFLKWPAVRKFNCQRELHFEFIRKDERGHVVLYVTSPFTTYEIFSMIEARQVPDDVRLLYELAALPFVTPLCSHCEKDSTSVIDCVRIDLTAAFDVFDKAKWDMNNELLEEKVSWILRMPAFEESMRHFEKNVLGED